MPGCLRLELKGANFLCGNSDMLIHLYQALVNLANMCVRRF